MQQVTTNGAAPTIEDLIKRIDDLEASVRYVDDARHETAEQLHDFIDSFAVKVTA